jgi:hypothetical protein
MIRRPCHQHRHLPAWSPDADAAPSRSIDIRLQMAWMGGIAGNAMA